MSNVYRYKNCIRLNLWNSTRPEIDGHCKCIFNVETQKFRLFKFGTWGGITYITEVEIVEITEYSEETRLSIIKAVKRRLYNHSDEHRPNGAWDLTDRLNMEFDSRNEEGTGTKGWWTYYPDHTSMTDYLFDIFDNYVGDIESPIFDMSEEYKSFSRLCRENFHPAIIRDVTENKKKDCISC